MLPALLVVATFLFLPVLEAFVSSLYVFPRFGDTTPRFVGLENYERLLEDRAALGSLGFTLIFVLVSVSLEIVLGLLLALVMHHTLRGQGLVRAAVLVPWAIPTVVVAVMWQYIFNDQYGLMNLLLYGEQVGRYQAWLAHTDSARLAIILADVWKTAAFAALLILAGLQTVPEELYEAAKLDGAGRLRRFFSVTLPLISPAILIAVLFRMMDAFRVFDLVYVMTGGGHGTDVLQHYGYRVMFAHMERGYGAALAVVTFLMIAVLAVVAIRLLGARLMRDEP